MKNRIVVADDERAVRDLLRTSLQRVGYEVEEAFDGEDAWQIISHLQPALVILDVKMPRLGGLELARRMRADPILAGIPIIVTSGAMPPEDAPDSFLDVAYRYVIKPFSPKSIIATVDELLYRDSQG